MPPATPPATQARPRSESEAGGGIRDRPLSHQRPANIADPFADLLAAVVDGRRRRGIVALLAVGYYDGWRPSRAEVTDLISAAATASAGRELNLDRGRRPTTVDRPTDPVDATPRPPWVERYSPVSF